MAETTAARDCPVCGQRAVQDPGFSPWCPACDWNVGARRVAEGDGRSERQRARDHARVEELAATVIAGGEPPAWRRGLAFGLAASVHALTALLVVGGLAVLVVGPNTALDVPIAGLLLLLAWLVRPRFGRWSKLQGVLGRAELPKTFALLDRIAGELGADPVDGVAVSTAFNASYLEVGYRRRSVVTVGLTLWNVLDAQERVFLLGHELAHDVNGDSRQGAVVGTALRTLREWHRVLKPRSRRLRLLNLYIGLVDLARWLLAEAALALHRAIASLTRQQHGAAEYRADALGARLAGSEAAVSALDAMSLADHLVTATRLALRRHDPDPWAAERRARAELPPLQRERFRRAARVRGDRADSSHPPTHHRIAALSVRPVPPGLPLGHDEAARLDAEWARLRPAVARTMVAQIEADDAKGRS